MLGGIAFQMGECQKDNQGRFPLLTKTQLSPSYYHCLHTFSFRVFCPVFQRCAVESYPEESMLLQAWWKAQPRRKFCRDGIQRNSPQWQWRPGRNGLQARNNVSCFASQHNLHLHPVCSSSYLNGGTHTNCPRSAVYRTIELTDGWSGKIISTQRYFSEHAFHLWYLGDKVRKSS